LLTAEDVHLECQSWIAKHSPKKGEPNFTALDFKHYLIGDFRLDPATTGYLNSPGPNGEPPICIRDQSVIAERTANAYLHRLGADYRALKRCTFSDHHEDFKPGSLDNGLNFSPLGPPKWMSPKMRCEPKHVFDNTEKKNIF
jgi:hypothetical protein